jgi:hypothetical protein
MDPQMQILMALLFFGGKGGGASAFQQALPAMMPGPVGTRVAASVLIARRELKQLDEKHTTIIKELVSSGLVSNEDTMKAKAPALHAVYLALPADLRDGIIFPPSPQGNARPADGSRKGERAAA